MSVKEVLKTKLQLPEIELKRAHRVGQGHNHGPRSVVARFCRFSDRDAIMRNANKL